MAPITHGNILAVFFSASEAEIQEGKAWYDQANLTCKEIAKRFNISTNQVAAIVAALSPNNRWHRNISDAESLIKVHSASGDPNSVKVGTYSKNKEKAIRILNKENPLNVLGGLKVRSFYSCLTGGDDVVVDGHAFAIWSGQRIPTTKTPKISPALYANIALDYRLATNVINAATSDSLTPCQVQAATWVTWRNQFIK